MEKDTWRMRRRFMLATVAFCKGVIMYVLIRDLQSAVAETAVNMSYFIVGTTVSSYVFGAAWEDINKRKTKRFPRHSGIDNERANNDRAFD